MSVEDILAVLLKEAQKRQLNPMQLSKKADIPYATAHTFMRGMTRQPALQTTIAIAGALGWTLELRDQKGQKLA